MRLGTAVHGAARRGRHGMVEHGAVRQGMAGSGQVRHGLARQGRRLRGKNEFIGKQVGMGSASFA